MPPAEYKSMKTIPGIAALLLTLPLNGCSQEPAPVVEADSTYQYSTASRDGIVKVYMGREISHVMGHLGAGWLERPGRVSEERTDLLLDNLPIEPGDKVADIGAGTGYFSLPMVQQVGETGTVYAVDIQQEMLDIIELRSTEQGITNVERVLAAADDPRLPPDTINMVLLVDAYHEFEWPYEVMTGIVNSLVSGGRVVLIEYRAEDPRVPIKNLHKMTAAQARMELEATGLEFESNLDLLPQQHFLIFRKP
jgi:precorrin-6B methylase 2